MTSTPEEWLAAHGGPRRFEPGASGEPYNLRRYLEGKGYFVMQRGAAWAVARGRGRIKTIGLRELIALADECRRADGLEPLAMPEADQ